jgi:hypothetical protein
MAGVMRVPDPDGFREGAADIIVLPVGKDRILQVQAQWTKRMLRQTRVDGKGCKHEARTCGVVDAATGIPNFGSTVLIIAEKPMDRGRNRSTRPKCWPERLTNVQPLRFTVPTSARTFDNEEVIHHVVDLPTLLPHVLSTRNRLKTRPPGANIALGWQLVGGCTGLPKRKFTMCRAAVHQ